MQCNSTGSKTWGKTIINLKCTFTSSFHFNCWTKSLFPWRGGKQRRKNLCVWQEYYEQKILHNKRGQNEEKSPSLHILACLRLLNEEEDPPPPLKQADTAAPIKVSSRGMERTPPRRNKKDGKYSDTRRKMKQEEEPYFCASEGKEFTLSRATKIDFFWQRGISELRWEEEGSKASISIDRCERYPKEENMKATRQPKLCLWRKN